MRQVAIHVESTGYHSDDRIVAIGAVERIDGHETDNTFLEYVNPEGKKSSSEALKVHKLSDDFLKGKPKFKQIADKFLAYIKGADEVVFHYPTFDINMMNNELSRCGKKDLHVQLKDSKFIDLHDEAKKYLNLANYKLETMINHFSIDDKNRRHKDRPLIDAQIFMEIYDRIKPLAEEAKMQRAKIRVMEEIKKSEPSQPAPIISETELARRAERAQSPAPLFKLNIFKAPKPKKVEKDEHHQVKRGMH